MEKFEIIPFDMQSAGSAYMRATVKVHGYWSSDVISLYLRRNWAYAQPSGRDTMWEMTISHSSGGRDTKVVSCDMEAEENFGLALIAVSKYAREFFAANIDEIELRYQEERAREKQEMEAAKEAKRLAFINDVSLGYTEAEKLIATLMDDERRFIKALRRGTQDDFVNVRVRIGRNVRFTLNGVSIAKNKLMEFLSLEVSTNKTTVV